MSKIPVCRLFNADFRWPWFKFISLAAATDEPMPMLKHNAAENFSVFENSQ